LPVKSISSAPTPMAATVQSAPMAASAAWTAATAALALPE